MATAAIDTPRAYEVGIEPTFTDLPVITNDIMYEGSAMGLTSGYVRPCTTSDTFLGFCEKQADNSTAPPNPVGGGASGAINVKIRQKGIVTLSVATASAVTNVGSSVYLSDDMTFTLASTGNLVIGKVVRWVTGTTCQVYFESLLLRSL